VLTEDEKKNQDGTFRKIKLGRGRGNEGSPLMGCRKRTWERGKGGVGHQNSWSERGGAERGGKYDPKTEVKKIEGKGARNGKRKKKKFGNKIC